MVPNSSVPHMTRPPCCYIFRFSSSLNHSSSSYIHIYNNNTFSTSHHLRRRWTTAIGCWIMDYGGYLELDPPNFSWPSSPPPTLSVELDDTYGNSEAFKESGSRKRSRSGSCNLSGSKACREKMRRDQLNDRFLELGSILDPGTGRPSKIDKAGILSDAVRVVTQLREEAQKLRQSTENLQGKINELKAEKNELRDEKQQLKAEKDIIEQKLKALSSQPSFLPHHSTLPTAFPAPRLVGSKLMPIIGYPGVSMWQFLPSAAVDTSQDHVLRPPVA